MTKSIYSLYILKNGAVDPETGKIAKRSREIGIATVNKDGSLTLHFDVPIPMDANNEPAKVFLRKIEKKAKAEPIAEVA